MKNKKFEISTKTMAYMAIFAALQIVLEYLTQFTPTMPNGGNISFFKRGYKIINKIKHVNNVARLYGTLYVKFATNGVAKAYHPEIK